MNPTATAPLVGTRESWHRVAEHVLAAGQFAAAGTIRLRRYPGGFATTVGVDGRQLAVVGDELVVSSGERRDAAPLTTVGELAAFAGVTPGLRGSYSPATSADPDAPLTVDRRDADVLAAWYALGDAALRRLADDLAPQDVVLWPEHLDLGITAAAVTYGCSPGDDAIPAPYLYVAPHAGRPAADGFWNAPFGAAATADRIRTTDDAVGFFRQGGSRIERSGT